ncbi:MAG: YbaB/EbfC family nucleoid-associated protein [Actinoplanes sp.]
MKVGNGGQTVPGGDLADRLATLTASATGDDGVVTVTVGGDGVVTGLRLDDQIQQFTGAKLSDEILRTMRRAQAALAEQVLAAVDETVGVRSEAGRAVLASVNRRFTDEPEPRPVEPVMPSAPFPTFRNTPTLPHQSPGNGFESGRDSRAR